MGTGETRPGDRGHRRLGIDTRFALIIALLLGVFTLFLLLAAGSLATQRLALTERAMEHTLREGLTRKHAESLRRNGDYLSNRLFNPLYRLDISRLNEEIEQIRLWLPVTEFIILDQEGRILTDGSEENRRYGERVALAQKPRPGEAIVTERPDDSELLFAIGYGDTLVGHARARIDNSALEKSVADLAAQGRYFRDQYSAHLLALGGISLLVVLGIGGLMSWRLSCSLTRPLLEMRDAAQAFARGELDRRLPVRGEDELAQLAADLNRMARKLGRSHQLLAAAQSISGIGSWEWEPASGRMEWSEQAYPVLGVEAERFKPGREAMLECVVAEDRPRLAMLLDQGPERGLDACEVRRRATDGSLRTLVLLAEPARGGGGEFSLIGTVQDVTEARETERRLSFLANYDSLTGLPNRYLFQDRLNHALSRAARSGQNLAVLFIDLDHFKAVNDALGHASGDHLLKDVSERLSEHVRKSDSVARFGGDEFTVLIEDCGAAEDVALLAEKLIEAMSRPFLLEGHVMHVSLSIGITLYPADAMDADDLLKNADIAMHQAKAAGRAAYRFFTEELNQQARKRLLLENRLHHALERGEFSIVYQPKVDAAEGRLIGVEALLRWNMEGRSVSPVEFIPILEGNGLILPVGRWILDTACRQVRAWQEKGLPGLRVAVNFSARQFRQGDLYESIARTLEATGLAAADLEVEITESTLMDVDAGAEVLDRLAGLGVRVAIDDFGTGYSSLTYLKRFSVHSLKIDRSFVTDITEDQDDAAIVAAIVGLAHSLDIQATAEGVETEAQLEFLRQHDCDLIQGYLFGRPLSAEAFWDWSAAHRRA